MRARPTFGFSIPPALDVQLQVRLAVFLEWLGFDRVWLPDHLAYPDWGQAPDVWSVLSAIAARTRRLGIGTAVSDPHRVPPAVFAQRIATLDRLSGGRLVVGLGSGEAMNLDPFDIPWDHRLGRLREVLDIVRGLLERSAPFTYEGRFHRLHDARLGIRPHRDRRVPVYLAALGPKMQELCGQQADGWYPVVIPHDHFAHYFEPIAAAAREAGRDPNEIERVASVPVALVDDETAARPMVVKAARRYALTLVWPPVLERMGMPLQPPPHLADASYITVNPADPESMDRYRALQRWIPEEVVMQFVYFGRMETLKRVVARYLDAGATCINLVNVSPDPLTSTVRLAAELLPAFTRRPPAVAARVARLGLPLLRRFVKLPQVDRAVLSEGKGAAEG